MHRYAPSTVEEVKVAQSQVQATDKQKIPSYFTKKHIFLLEYLRKWRKSSTFARFLCDWARKSATCSRLTQ